jgi:hypothetical protein
MGIDIDVARLTRIPRAQGMLYGVPGTHPPAH